MNKKFEILKQLCLKNKQKFKKNELALCKDLFFLPPETILKEQLYRSWQNLHDNENKMNHGNNSFSKLNKSIENSIIYEKEIRKQLINAQKTFKPININNLNSVCSELSEIFGKEYKENIKFSIEKSFEAKNFLENITKNEINISNNNNNDNLIENENKLYLRLKIKDKNEIKNFSQTLFINSEKTCKNLSDLIVCKNDFIQKIYFFRPILDNFDGNEKTNENKFTERKMKKIICDVKNYEKEFFIVNSDEVLEKMNSQTSLQNIYKICSENKRNFFFFSHLFNCIHLIEIKNIFEQKGSLINKKDVWCKKLEGNFYLKCYLCEKFNANTIIVCDEKLPYSQFYLCSSEECRKIINLLDSNN